MIPEFTCPDIRKSLVCGGILTTDTGKYEQGNVVFLSNGQNWIGIKAQMILVHNAVYFFKNNKYTPGKRVLLCRSRLFFSKNSEIQLMYAFAKG